MQLSNLTGLFVAGSADSIRSRGAVNRVRIRGGLKGNGIDGGVGACTIKLACPTLRAIRVRRPRALLSLSGRAA